MFLDLSLAAFTASFLLIVLAEMGDKTQFVAMSFAARLSAVKVLAAIFLATVGNFAIVIVVGQLLTTVVPLNAVSLAASASFIGFGLWTLREEKTVEQNMRFSRFGVTATVALTFFLAEFGDKTQLTTLSLAAQYHSPVSVLVGATLGMLVADGVGIGVGVVLCRRIPQRLLRWVSAVIFVVFGLAGIYAVLNTEINVVYTASILAALTVFSVSIMIYVAKRQKTAEKTREPQTSQPTPAMQGK